MFRRKQYRGSFLLLACLTLCASADATVFTYVTIPTSNNIQSELYSTFPTGTFVANNALATPFSIPSAPGTCGPSKASPCNYYDGFGFSGNGTSITMNVSVANPTDVYTLMNAYKPAAGQQLATIQFVGTGGVSVAFPLIGGKDIRDYRQSVFASTLANGISGVQALNAFSCNDPANCISIAGGADNLFADEQHFSLGPAFAGQTLTEIILTDTYNGSSPILLGVTVGSGSAESAQSIEVQDPSFETATLPLNGGGGPFSNLIVGSTAYPTDGTLANWTVASTTPAAWAGAWDPNLGGANWNYKWWSGNNIGYIAIIGAGTVSLSQTLSATLQNNATYTLSAVIGIAINPVAYNYSLQLWAGSTMLASTSKLEGLPNDSSGTDSVSYSSGGNNPEAGQPLKIVVSATGVKGVTTGAFFDEVALYASSGVSVSGVVSASAFGGFTSIAPGSWIEIYGSNLAADSRSWGGSDFTGVNAPTSLDGTSVSIGGYSAFVDFISTGQVNAQVPSNVGTGPQNLTVKTAGSASTPLSITVNALEPGLLAPASFNIGGTQYVVAQFVDGTYVLPEGAISGLASRPAKPGDTIVLYGVGFGPVTPEIPAGQIVQVANTLASPFAISIGGTPAIADYFGLAPSYVGLYQFNVVVPNVASSGAAPLTFTLDKAAGTQTLYVAVQN